MTVVTKHLDSFEKPFVVDNVNHIIAAADTHLARCIGENANWQPMREFKFSPKWTEGIGFGDRLTHVLGTNPFTDAGNFSPRLVKKGSFSLGKGSINKLEPFLSLTLLAFRKGSTCLELQRSILTW